MGQRGTVIGTIGMVAMGVIGVAVIYQLGAHKNPVAGDVTQITNTTLNNLFK